MVMNITKIFIPLISEFVNVRDYKTVKNTILLYIKLCMFFKHCTVYSYTYARFYHLWSFWDYPVIQRLGIKAHSHQARVRPSRYQAFSAGTTDCSTLKACTAISEIIRTDSAVH